MKYVVKLLENVSNVNSFSVVDESAIQLGTNFDLYFQLFTLKIDKCGVETLTRYIPQGTNNYIEIKFNNIDDDFAFCRVASQAFQGDTSIWKFPVLSQDQIPFGSMEVYLYEDNKKIRFSVETDIVSDPADIEREWFV